MAVNIDEKEKYDFLYKIRSHKFPTRYNLGKDATEFIINELKPLSIIDCGCAGNMFLKEIRYRMPGIKSIGVDFSCNHSDLICDIKDLPFDDKEFDLSTAFDVMEHIPEDEIDLVLAEMVRVSNRFIFSIAYNEAEFKCKGRIIKFHVSVFPEEWWINKLNRYCGDVKKYGKYLYGVWSYSN